MRRVRVVTGPLTVVLALAAVITLLSVGLYVAFPPQSDAAPTGGPGCQYFPTNYTYRCHLTYNQTGGNSGDNGTYVPEPPRTARTESLVQPDVSTPNTIQLTTTASRSQFTQTTFWQNGTGTYTTGNVPVTVVSNLSGATVNTVYSSTLAIYTSMLNGMSPILNVTQGTGNTLVNATYVNSTVPLPLTVSPKVSSTVVKIRAVAAFTRTGLRPANGSYPIFTNITQKVGYLKTNVPVWQLQNGTRENLSYGVTPPSGYILNQTSIFIPFPQGASANASSFNITTKVGAIQKNLTTYQLVNGGVYALLPGTSAATTVSVAFFALGVTTGPAVSIPLGNVYGVGGGKSGANASWINTRTLPYSGTIFITFNSSKFPIVPGTLNLTANRQWIRNNTYVLSGNAILVLPNSVTVGVGRVVVFQASFVLQGVVPSTSLCVTCPGTGGISILDLVVVAELILLGYLFVGGRRQRNASILSGTRWKPTDHWWAAAYAFVFILLVYLLAVLLQATGS